MCYWFLCVPFTRTFATTEESSADAEESTCLRRGFLVSLDVVGYLILLATVVCLQGCLLLVLFLSGGHFRHKFGWFVNAFLSATIIIIIPTAISFILWSKRKNVSTPAEQILEMDSMSTIDSAPDSVQTPAEKIVEMGTTSTIDLAPVQLGELTVEIADSKERIQESEAGPSFVFECCAKRLLPFYIIVILLSEIALIFLNPFDSIFPIGIASDEIVVPLEGEFMRSKHCPSCPDYCTNIEQKVREARAFYKHSLVDFSVVRIGYGGIPKHFNDGTTGAQAIDRSVYLALDACPETWLMIHEFAHVWQMQSGWWFQNGVSKLIRYKKEENEVDLYDYGGLEGLRNAAEDPHATMTSAFWVEQQAQIVEDYYECLHSFWLWCSSEEQQLLMRFSNDILYDDSKLGKKSCEVEDLILTWVASEDCPPKVLSLSEDLSEHYAYYAESANEIEASTDGVIGDGLQFPGCSSVYLNVKLKEGISSGFCECDNNDDLCNLSFNDAENQESSNCGIYDIYQWSCPNEANH